MLDSTLVIDNFFSDKDLQPFDLAADQIDTNATNVIIPHGPFANKLITRFVDLRDNSAAVDTLRKKIDPLFDTRSPIFYTDFTLIELFFPWDVHSDLYLERTIEGYKPYYNFLIPLHDVDSRTFIFDQFSETYHEFWKYKQEHEKLENPIDIELWQNNLSMCWDDDRYYLSIMKIMPYQRRGQLTGFNRKYFHSSDNFHTRGISSKKFVQVRVDVCDE